MRDPPADQHDPNPLVAAPQAPPVRLLIPSLNIDAQVESLGVDSSGAMETPHNIWKVGWYRGGPSPGGPGDAVIDGHVGLPGSPLVFSGLARLTIGADVITCTGRYDSGSQTYADRLIVVYAGPV